MLRKLAGLTVLIVLLGAWAASAQTIYGSAHNGANGQSTLYLISPTTGAATPIGPIGFLQVGALALAPNGTLYGITSTASGGRGTAQLLTINTATGAGTVVGDTGVTLNFNDIAFRSDGTLFALAGQGRNLYTINTTTGLASEPLATGSQGAGNGLAFSSANVLYTAITRVVNNANVSELDVLNQSTGARTLAVPLDYSQFGTTESRASGMKFDPSTSKLYAVVATVAIGGPQPQTWSLGIINISTGVVTRIGATIAGLDGIAITGTSPSIHSFCFWGLYIHNLGQGWESRLFISNLDTQAGHSYDAFVLATNTVLQTSFALGPSGIQGFDCVALHACGQAGWLYVQSDASVFGATLFVINNVFGGGAFTAQSPDCLFGRP